MHDETDVSDLLLHPTTTPASPGRPYSLRGRAALPVGTEVSIEGDTGSGFQPVAAATVSADGTFAATVIPAMTTTYRAVRAQAVAPSVLVRVLDHHVLISQSRVRGRDVVRVRVTPAAPGSTVVLQLYLRERLGWWPAQQSRLNRRSEARFSLQLDRCVRARVALTVPDGATELSLSPIVMVGQNGGRAGDV